MARVTQRGSGLVTATSDLQAPSTAETFSINNPRHRAAAAVRLANWGLSGSKQDVTAGREWYHQAHSVVGESARTHGISMTKAAAVTSILSPGSDWSQRNIAALDQSMSLKTHEWKDIKDSNVAQTAARDARKAAGTAEPGERVKRHSDIQAMLQVRAPSLAGSTDNQLLKVHGVLQGRLTPEQVFPRATSPKTKAFYHGIMHPGHMSGQVPIDYRMGDIAANKMRPYPTERYIGKDQMTRADVAAGHTQSTYAAHEQLVGEAGRTMAMRGGRGFASMKQPLAAQAYLWHLGKQMELGHPQAKQSRQRPGEAHSGPVRKGYSYTDPSGRPSW